MAELLPEEKSSKSKRQNCSPCSSEAVKVGRFGGAAAIEESWPQAQIEGIAREAFHDVDHEA